MRLPANRPLAAIALAALVTSTAVVVAGPVGAQAPAPAEEPAPIQEERPSDLPVEAPPAELPVGFLDGVPVGDDPAEIAADEALAAELAGSTPSTSAPAVATRAAASTTRYFGEGAWSAIRSAANAAPRPCRVSDNGLTALMVSPIFKESSAATTPSSAPSPMTLARADEWTSGQRLTTSNLHANYGLYENQDPNTPYQRAYWHPGIGIWQYDSAGVGAPYTAIERMAVDIVGADVARGMITRYCNASGSDSAKRRAAWQPWGIACTTSNLAANLCEIEFQAMVGSGDPAFANISLVGGISATGGAVQRSCRIGTETLPCWYVDPGRSEGAVGWKYNPSGGPDWRTRPTPLSTAFYVVKRDGREERHWLRVDSGYPVDISASRIIGKNARPRSGSSNVGSGLTWSRSSSLCDLTTRRGACGSGSSTVPAGLEPPAGVQARPVSVGGDYRPITLDVDGDGHDDVFWYAPGPAGDYLWRNRGDGTFSSTSVPVNGSYEFVEVLDVDGDGRDDVLWYHPTGALAHLWHSRGDGTFARSHVDIGPGLEPLVLDVTGARDSVLLYGAGAGAERWLRWNGSGLAVASAPQVGGHYEPFVGDFDGNGRDDVFWYAPGDAPDYVWLHRNAGGYLDLHVTIGSDYQPLVGDFDGDRKDDIVWYRAGTTTEQIWWGAAQGRFATGTFIVNDDYVPVVADLEGDGRDDVLWYHPSTSGEKLWTRWSEGRGRASVSADWPSGYQPLGGAFGPSGGGLLWYGPGGLSDVLWWS